MEPSTIAMLAQLVPLVISLKAKAGKGDKERWIANAEKAQKIISRILEDTR